MSNSSNNFVFMKHISNLHSIQPQNGFIAEIDMTGTLGRLFHFPQQIDGTLFIMCVRGECQLTIHLSRISIKANDLTTVLPNSFIHIHHQSHDCRLYLIGFPRDLLKRNSSFSSFSSTISFLSSLIDNPVITLKQNIANIFTESAKTLIKINRSTDVTLNEEFIAGILLTIFQGLSCLYSSASTLKPSFSRGEEIVKRLIQHIIRDYKSERNVTYYADLLHVSPQHLSTTVKKVAGRTITDIIASLVVTDAQAKLKSTDMSVQEIAYSLNFPDISFFGKYFKRYAGVSPKQYRES